MIEFKKIKNRIKIKEILTLINYLQYIYYFPFYNIKYHKINIFYY